jgi:hypothetical protein
MDVMLAPGQTAPFTLASLGREPSALPDPSLNTPVEAQRLEAARAAMENWKGYTHACQARHNAHRQRLSRR